MRYLRLILVLLVLAPVAHSASKLHIMSLGKPTPVKLLLGASEEKSVNITIRPLFLDTKLKEYTTGPAHDITDRVFVIRRAYRVNDSLPNESSNQPRWLCNAEAGCWWTATPAA
jgi:hypothetical protein